MDNEFRAPASGQRPERITIEDWHLADAGTRFVARFVDNLAGLAAMVPGLVMTMAVASSLDDDARLGVGVLAMGAPYLGVTGYQWWTTAADGTTIGKRMNRIRIVRIDGEPMDFLHGVVLRTWVLALPQVLLGSVGSVVQLVDALMVFSDQSRTLHDRIAGTLVVRDTRSTPGETDEP